MNLTPQGLARPLAPLERARRVTAVLGPTNTGKTHLAIERMVAHTSGIIGLPLRLLAREVYNRVVERVGVEAVALITGEEKIKPRNPRFWVSTVEAMPRDLDVAFVAVDEIQLAADLDRGHVFTDRLLHRRGREETMLIGAETMRPLVEQLLPGAHVTTRPRLSQLTFAGERKLSRLPRRSAIVAFSAEEVYAIAELIRRQRGGAAVVMGALSPRTRNAQVDLYQQGDVDYIVATDAIGMGLNLDVDHLAFAGDRKFDGWHYRRLNPAEFAQVAGRAGRHLKDGTFGTTGRCPPFDEDLVAAIEQHRFDPLAMLQWRNSDLDFSSIESLQATLDRLPTERGLTRAPLATDILVLDIASHDADVRKSAVNRGDVQRLWDVCQVPDYRKLSPAAHAELALTLYGFVVRAGRIPDDWFARQLAGLDRTEGDIDVLSARLAQVRTFNYIANRPDWLRDPEHWQGVTRQVEDSLSDALHVRLAHRFVDRRTSVLMRRLRENAMLEAEITGSGDVLVEGQHVGSLQGFRFTPDPGAAGEAARTLNAVAQKVLATEMETRARRVHDAVDTAFVLAHDGLVRWLGEPVGRLVAGDHILRPKVRILADDQLTGPALEMAQIRLDLWITQYIKKLLGPLLDLETGEGLEGIARGIAFQVAESLGVLERARVATELKGLDQNARGALRKMGIRFGAYHLFLPLLLKPAPRALAAQLWALKHGAESLKGLDEVPHLAASGRTSIPANKEIDRRFYLAAGFRVSGERAVRVDILERLADLIRPAINYRPGVTPGAPPPGAADRDGFVVTVGMTSLAGCSGEPFASILKSLGYVMEARPGPAITVPLLPAAATTPVVPTVSAEVLDEPVALAEIAQGDVDASAFVGVEAPEREADEPAGAQQNDPAELAAEAASGDVDTVSADATPLAAEPAASEQPAVPEAPATAAEEPSIVMEAAPDIDMAGSEVLVPADAPAETASEEQVEAAPADAEATPAETQAASDETPAAPATIEVWRPHRRPQHQGQRPPNRQNRERPAAGQQRRPWARRDAPAAPAAATPPDAAAAPAADQVAQTAPADQSRRESDRNGPRRFQGRPKPDSRPKRDGDRNQERPAGDRPGRPRFEGNRDRRPDRPEGRTFASSERPRREKQPDPDSPFAKLAALKAQLEGKSKPE